MRWVGLIIAIIGAGMLFLYTPAVVWQHTLITSAQPTQATITDSRVSEYRGRKNRKRYRAVVSFNYVVDGQTYFSNRLNAAGFSIGGSTRATSFVARFPPGPAQVFVSPLAPEKGFLDSAYHHAPYTLFIVGLGVFSGGLLIFLLNPSKREPTVVEGSSPTLWLLPAGVSLRTRWLAMTLTGGAWTLGAIVAGAHYLSTSRHADSDAAFWIFSGLSLTTAVVTLARGLWVFNIARTFGEPRVMLDSAQPQRGQKLLVVVEQLVKSSARVDAIDVTLVCTESITTGAGKSRHTKTREAWSELQSVLSNGQHETLGDQTIVRGAAWFTPPNSTMPTSAPTEIEQRYDWKIALRSHARGPDYKAEWKVIVV